MYNKFQGKSWIINYCVKNEHNFPIFFFLFGNIFFKKPPIYVVKCFLEAEGFPANVLGTIKSPRTK